MVDIQSKFNLGDKIYVIVKLFDQEKIESLYGIRCKVIDYIDSRIIECGGSIYSALDIDKTIFTTREEAERALERMSTL